MSQAAPKANTYDEIPYPSEPLPYAHPDRLATIARLFGMQPQAIDRCRVLELGCGTGGNLIPMAERHPGSSFVGVDYSLNQVVAGREAIQSLGLENIELKHLNILDASGELGTYDYIICHGVYSWVPPVLQEKVLHLCKACLAPQGVAYVSYNAYPAWHLRSIVRELALSGSSPDERPAERVRKLRRALTFLGGALGDETTPYAKYMRDDFEFIFHQRDNYLFHEYFEDENSPLYFYEFAERATRHGLLYVGDAILSTWFPANLGPVAEKNLAPFSTDVISAEQHMDALRSRSFRQTILCHADVPLQRHLGLASLEGLYLAGELRPENATPDLKSQKSERFLIPSGTTVGSPAPVVKAALHHLSQSWPRAMSLDELLAGAAALLGSEGAPATISAMDRQSLGDNLVQCLVAGLVEARSAPDSFVTTVSERPCTSLLARTQARTGPQVNNRRHEVVNLDDVLQNTLAHLDGQRDRAELLRILRDSMESGRLSVFKDGVPVGRVDVADEILELALEQCLSKLAARALLIA